MVATNRPSKKSSSGLEGAPEVIALKSRKDRVEERVELFSIDDKGYSIPTAIRPNQSLQIMHVFREKGDAAGTSFMLETLLGSEGYDALINFDDLDEEDLEKIITIAFKLVNSASSDKTKN